MARRVDDEMVRALKSRQETNGLGIEAKYRTIPSAAEGVRRDAFIKVLTSMPNVGVDADFQRVDLIEGFPPIAD